MKKFIPLLAGSFISLMATLNTELSQKIGEGYSVFIIHFAGFILLTLFSILYGSRIKFDRKIPIWFYMGGGIGIFVVLFNNLSIKNIGVSLTLSLGIAGQIITSIFLEHIGFLGTEKKRFRISMLPGIVMILAGSIMIII
jgi:transporter family-2 protein